jgi:pimeloyl-ACP methyl ester carboxylesterase
MLGLDTAGLMDAIGFKNAAVMGHSMGGFVAQELAVTRPDLVGKLILSGTNFGGPNHIPLTPEGLKAIMDRSGDPLDVLKRGVTLAAAPGFPERQPKIFDEIIAYRLTFPVPPAQWQSQTAVGLGLATLEASFEPKLAQLKMPTLIMFGEHDRVVPPANAELFHQRIAKSVVKIIPEAGHIFPLETPDEANEIVTTFLKSS